MITAIEIENFKSIGESTKFELSDITLLYGPNSAGKSSIIQAIHYLHEILSKANADPMYSSLEEGVYLGGFRNLVHQRDLKRKITITVEFQLEKALGTGYLDDFYTWFGKLNHIPFNEELVRLVEWTRRRMLDWAREYDMTNMDFPEHYHFGGIPIRQAPQNATFSVTVGWNRRRESPTVLSSHSKLNGIPISTAYWKHGYFLMKLSSQALDFFPSHDFSFVDWLDLRDELLPLTHRTRPSFSDMHLRTTTVAASVLKVYEHMDSMPPIFSLNAESTEGQKKANEILKSESVLVDQWQRLKGRAMENEPWTEIARNAAPELFPKFFATEQHPNCCFGSFVPPFLDPIPPDGYSEETVYEESVRFEQKGDAKTIQAVNSAWLFGHLVSIVIQASLKSRISRFVHLGPLREHYEPTVGGTEKKSRGWYQGLAAWDSLLNDEENAVQTGCLTSEWLSNAERFATGYIIEIVKNHVIPTDETIVQKLVNATTPEECQNVLQHFDTHKFAQVVDERYGLKLKSVEVGTGVSQILPVIVAALAPSGLVIMEQPELHLHPRAQLIIADLLIASLHPQYYFLFPQQENSKLRNHKFSRDRQFIVETHSEHIALRLLRRIRETSEGLQQDEDLRLTPDQLAVNYALPTDNGLQISRLRVDESGEFIDRWPSGFFDERSEELF